MQVMNVLILNTRRAVADGGFLIPWATAAAESPRPTLLPLHSVPGRALASSLTRCTTGFTN
jgi:hypothetical protein